MTLKDVAKLSNCSVATVSKALKDSPEISEEAKQRIVSVAKESGYFKKATTHKAVLGGFKTVIFNDVKGDSAHLVSLLIKTAKKYGLVLLCVSLSVSDAKELMNQIGALGLVVVGVDAKNEEKVLYMSDDMNEAISFLKWLSEYKQKRPSRAGATNKKPSAKEDIVTETLIPPQTEDDETEEIWLL